MQLRFRAARHHLLSSLKTIPTTAMSTTPLTTTTTTTTSPTTPIPPKPTASPILDAWQKSRRPTSTQNYASPPDAFYLRSGVPRPLTIQNIYLAIFLLRQCWFHIFQIVITLHPIRMPLMIIFNVIRGLLPAYQSYSQANILNEIQKVVITDGFSSQDRDIKPLAWLILIESSRMICVRLFDTYVENNAEIVQQSVRLHFQYLQMQNRLRLDIPALADPIVQDLLEESNRFVSSFSSGSNTALTPLGLVSLIADISQFFSQAYLLYSILWHNSPLSPSHLLTISYVAFSRFPGFFRRAQNWLLPSEDDWPDEKFEQRSSAVKRRISQMENLAYSVTYKAEVVLFGLADWILESWMTAKREDLELDRMVNSRGVFTSTQSSRTNAAIRAFFVESFNEVYDLLRNIPYVVQYTHSSLGTVNLTRTASERLCASAISIHTCMRWSFDAAFDLGAFHCAMTMRPYLQAEKESKVSYASSRPVNGQRGMKIELKNLGFSFPGQKEPTLRGVNLSIEPGESVAIVGLNGSGKTTLLHVLARLVDFTSGSMLINNIDSRQYDASDLHAHTSAIFQSFCKFEHTSVRENTGMGDVGRMRSDEDVREALKAAGALGIVDTFEMGLETRLEVDGEGYGRQLRFPRHHHYDHPPPPYASSVLPPFRHAAASSGPLGNESNAAGVGVGASGKRVGSARLSGGQWQRIAISRALMRADTYDLMLVDEANSALDLRGQQELFEGLVKPPNHGTIVFVTHRLEALRWADKIAVVEDGKITSFGTFDNVSEDIRRVFGLKEDAL